MTHNTMDDVIEEWKDVLPGDVTSEQAWDTGWELVHADVAKVHDRTSLEILKDYVKKDLVEKISLLHLSMRERGSNYRIKSRIICYFLKYMKTLGKISSFRYWVSKMLKEAEMQTSCMRQRNQWRFTRS